jgi:hypothetical protein
MIDDRVMPVVKASIRSIRHEERNLKYHFTIFRLILHPMGQMRSHIISKLLALVTGVVFLNMGFLLFELRVMDLQYSEQEMKEIISLVSLVGFEEEKDGSSSSAGETLSEQIVDLHITTHPAQDVAFILILNSLYASDGHLLFEAPKPEIATPPPKVS